MYYVPFCPVGDKTVSARCRNCGEPFRSESLLSHYKQISKTPFYYFSLPILFSSLVILVTILNSNTQEDKLAFVTNPKAGDVYTIRHDENNKTTYYFLRLKSLHGDTLVMYHNALEYSGYTSSFTKEDYFVKDEELFFLKPELIKMLTRKEINAVDRDYSDYNGFDRIE